MAWYLRRASELGFESRDGLARLTPLQRGRAAEGAAEADPIGLPQRLDSQVGAASPRCDCGLTSRRCTPNSRPFSVPATDKWFAHTTLAAARLGYTRQETGSWNPVTVTCTSFATRAKLTSLRWPFKSFRPTPNGEHTLQGPSTEHSRPEPGLARSLSREWRF
jgi:hypothetical protein